MDWKFSFFVSLEISKANEENVLPDSFDQKLIEAVLWLHQENVFSFKFLFDFLSLINECSLKAKYNINYLALTDLLFPLRILRNENVGFLFTQKTIVTFILHQYYFKAASMDFMPTSFEEHMIIIIFHEFLFIEIG